VSLLFGRGKINKKPCPLLKDRVLTCGTTLFGLIESPPQQSAITLLSTYVGCHVSDTRPSTHGRSPCPQEPIILTRYLSGFHHPRLAVRTAISFTSPSKVYFIQLIMEVYHYFCALSTDFLFIFCVQPTNTCDIFHQSGINIHMSFCILLP